MQSVATRAVQTLPSGAAAPNSPVSHGTYYSVVLAHNDLPVLAFAAPSSLLPLANTTTAAAAAATEAARRNSQGTIAPTPGNTVAGTVLATGGAALLLASVAASNAKSGEVAQFVPYTAVGSGFSGPHVTLAFWGVPMAMRPVWVDVQVQLQIVARPKKAGGTSAAAVATTEDSDMGVTDGDTSGDGDGDNDEDADDEDADTNGTDTDATAEVDALMAETESGTDSGESDVSVSTMGYKWIPKRVHTLALKAANTSMFHRDIENVISDDTIDTDANVFHGDAKDIAQRLSIREEKQTVSPVNKDKTNGDGTKKNSRRTKKENPRAVTPLSSATTILTDEKQTRTRQTSNLRQQSLLRSQSLMGDRSEAMRGSRWWERDRFTAPVKITPVMLDQSGLTLAQQVEQQQKELSSALGLGAQQQDRGVATSSDDESDDCKLNTECFAALVKKQQRDKLTQDNTIHRDVSAMTSDTSSRGHAARSPLSPARLWAKSAVTHLSQHKPLLPQTLSLEQQQENDLQEKQESSQTPHGEPQSLNPRSTAAFLGDDQGHPMTRLDLSTPLPGGPVDNFTPYTPLPNTTVTGTGSANVTAAVAAITANTVKLSNNVTVAYDSNVPVVRMAMQTLEGAKVNSSLTPVFVLDANLVLLRDPAIIANLTNTATAANTTATSLGNQSMQAWPDNMLVMLYQFIIKDNVTRSTLATPWFAWGTDLPPYAETRPAASLPATAALPPFVPGAATASSAATSSSVAVSGRANLTRTEVTVPLIRNATPLPPDTRARAPAVVSTPAAAAAAASAGASAALTATPTLPVPPVASTTGAALTTAAPAGLATSSASSTGTSTASGITSTAVNATEEAFRAHEFPTSQYYPQLGWNVTWFLLNYQPSSPYLLRHDVIHISRDAISSFATNPSSSTVSSFTTLSEKKSTKNNKHNTPNLNKNENDGNSTNKNSSSHRFTTTATDQTSAFFAGGGANTPMATMTDNTYLIIVIPSLVLDETATIDAMSIDIYINDELQGTFPLTAMPAAPVDPASRSATRSGQPFNLHDDPQAYVRPFAGKRFASPHIALAPNDLLAYMIHYTVRPKDSFIPIWADKKRPAFLPMSLTTTLFPWSGPRAYVHAILPISSVSPDPAEIRTAPIFKYSIKFRSSLPAARAALHFVVGRMAAHEGGLLAIPPVDPGVCFASNQVR